MTFLFMAKRKGETNDEDNPYIHFAADQSIEWELVEHFVRGRMLPKRWVPNTPTSPSLVQFHQIRIFDSNGGEIGGPVNWIDWEH